jgi:hypothetical protein
LKEPQTSTAFLFKANQSLEKKFGTNHPLLQKYYAFASEVASQADNNEMMLEMSEKQLRLSEATNKTKAGDDSIFMLDPLLTVVSA